MSNDQERAFGLDPTIGSSVNPISIPLNRSTGTFTYTSPLTDFTTKEEEKVFALPMMCYYCHINLPAIYHLAKI